MAHYNITYRCGHDGRIDIAGPTKDRQRKADYVAGKLCHECEQERITTAAKASGLPELIGSERQVDWAVRLRADLLKRIAAAVPIFNKHLSATDQQAIVDRYTAETSAKWWIDNRGMNINRSTFFEAAV